MEKNMLQRLILNEFRAFENKKMHVMVFKLDY